MMRRILAAKRRRHGSCRLLLLALFGVVASAWAEPPPRTGDAVVLLHGLGRTSASMSSLAEQLRAAGFTPHNLDYASTDATPTELVAWLREAVIDCCAAAPGRVHFVTHSLGGIVVRAALAEQHPANLGRVVQLAPPNQGSEIVDELGKNPAFAAVVGPTGSDLGTEPDSFPNRIGPPDYEVGIIAGDRSINPIGSALLPGLDDGSVTVERAHLEGARDFLVVDVDHTFIVLDEEVGRQVIHFLRDGRFDHAASASRAQAPNSAP